MVSSTCLQDCVPSGESRRAWPFLASRDCMYSLTCGLPLDNISGICLSPLASKISAYWDSSRSHPMFTCILYNKLVTVNTELSWGLCVVLVHYHIWGSYGEPQISRRPKCFGIWHTAHVAGIWSEGSLVRLSPYLMGCLITQSSWCQNWIDMNYWTPSWCQKVDVGVHLD